MVFSQKDFDTISRLAQGETSHWMIFPSLKKDFIDSIYAGKMYLIDDHVSFVLSVIWQCFCKDTVSMAPHTLKQFASRIYTRGALLIAKHIKLATNNRLQTLLIKNYVPRY